MAGVALAGRLLLSAQSLAALHLPCCPVPLAAWRTMVVDWRTLMAKSGLAESLARPGVSAPQWLAPVYPGGLPNQCSLLAEQENPC